MKSVTTPYGTMALRKGSTHPKTRRPQPEFCSPVIRLPFSAWLLAGMTGFVCEQEEQLARGNQPKLFARNFFDRGWILSQAAGLMAKSRVLAAKAGDVIDEHTVSASGLQCVHKPVFPYQGIRDEHRRTQQKREL